MMSSAFFEEQAEEIVARPEPLGDLPELGHVLLHRDEVGDHPASPVTGVTFAPRYRGCRPCGG